ncbi:MAG: hypothetical protein IIC28_12785, partial [Chloroflexi bacterium]|nr:hypothetical protein [Chloroflexota bacterium]
MPENEEGRGWLGPALIVGAVGFAIWRRLSPDTRETIWRSLENAAAEHERRKMAELAQAERLLILPPIDLEFGSGFLDIPPAAIDSVVEAAPWETRLQAAVAKFELPDPDNGAPETPVTANPDRKWLDVIQHPSVVVILGKRGSGKSALGYRLL